jgi:serine protease AprX
MNYLIRLICLVFIPFHFVCASTQSLTDISSELKEKLDILVYLTPKGGLVEARHILDREQRIRTVVETLVDYSQQTQAPLLSLLTANAYQYKSFFVENVVHIPQADRGLIEQIGKLPNVISVRINSKIKMDMPEMEFVKRDSRVEPHIKLIEADKVWSQLGVMGEGIVVGGADTGVYWQHNSIKKQYRGYLGEGAVDHNYNWHDAIGGESSGFCTQSSPEPCDDRNHGTHTIGTMVGDDGRGQQIGVAPQAQWIACRNMKEGVGTVATYLECFQFFMAPYPRGGDPKQDGRPELAPHIVNNSWSCPSSEGCRGDEFMQTVQAYKDAGILLVAAAGNYGPRCGSVSNTPARHAGDILVVGAYNTFLNEVAFFSARGPSNLEQRLAPNIVAPGAFVRSAVTTGPDDYDDKPGTSMASPQAAGVVALLWSHRPELIGQVESTIRIIEQSAEGARAKASCPGYPANQVPNAEYGYGMLNALKALQL